MQKAGKDSGGRHFELWLMANALCGQLPINKDEAAEVIRLLNESFQIFINKETPDNSTNTKPAYNDPRSQFKIIENEFNSE